MIICKRCSMKNPYPEYEYCTKCRIETDRIQYDVTDSDKAGSTFISRVKAYGVTVAEMLRILDMQNGNCPLCREQLECSNGIPTGNTHIDHIVPKSWGGKDEIANYQLLCRRCNLKKSNRTEGFFENAKSIAQYPEVYEALRSVLNGSGRLDTLLEQIEEVNNVTKNGVYG